jgi:uncharacterized YccA/Bax inhibitor family protein
MPLWQRLLATVVAMLVTSYLVGLFWQWAFSSSMPGYLSGVIGGITAVPVWEFLKRIQPRPPG